MILITEPERSARSQLRRALHGDLRELSTTNELEHELALAPEGPSVVILGPGMPIDDALATAAWLQERGSPVATLLISDDVSTELLRAAMRAGVRDVLPRTVPGEQLQEAVDRALGLAQRQPGAVAPAAEGTGKILTVFSTKGGSGKSVVASNLALLLHQRTKEPVVLVDLDLQSGDLAIMLQLTPSWTLYDACEDTTRLDRDALAGYLTTHRSGVALLAAPLDPALADTIRPEAIQEVLRLLATQFTYVIVDGPASFTDQVIGALDVSNETVLLASMDVPSVKNLKLALETLARLDITRNRIHVVLNRADSKVGLRLQEVEKSLGTPIDVAVPSSRDVPLSVNQGTPLALDARKSPVVTAIARLVERVRIPAAAATSSKRRALLGKG